MLRDLRFRLRALVRRDRAEDDLDEELRFHLERTVEQHVARGLSPREARRRARLDFGPLDAVKDDCRQSWGIRQLDILGRDLACALRLMRKHPALSTIAAVSLAVGIGLMALGATPRDVLGLVARQGAFSVAVGAAVGAALAFAAARATAGVLFGVDAADPLAWGGAVVTLAVVGALAHALPARRAVGVAPAAALRVE